MAVLKRLSPTPVLASENAIMDHLADGTLRELRDALDDACPKVAQLHLPAQIALMHATT